METITHAPQPKMARVKAQMVEQLEDAIERLEAKIDRYDSTGMNLTPLLTELSDKQRQLDMLKGFLTRVG